MSIFVPDVSPADVTNEQIRKARHMFDDVPMELVCDVALYSCDPVLRERARELVADFINRKMDIYGIRP